MALFEKLSTARQSVIIDDIENLQSQINSKEDDITALQDRLDIEVAKIKALQSLTTSHTSQLNTNGDTLALNLKIENEIIKTVALQSLTESHTSQITSHDGDITALQGRLDIEEQNIIDLDDLTANHIDDIDALQTLTASHTEDITALETLTASHTTDITALETLTASHTTDITALETLTASHTADILTKLDTINDGDLTIAKTDGLLTALDSTAKLALANTFTGLQTVNGDLKADHVLVKITAPTLNTHLTSKLYVDTALIGKQNTLTAGTGIDITDNVISSTSTSSNSSFVGFRVETAQEVDMRIGTGSTIPFNVKTGGIGFLYDTHNMYNITTYEYTIPTGYSGYWVFNMRLFIAEYAENKRRIHLRVTRGSSNFEPLQIGNFYGQVESLSGTIPVLEGDIIKVYVQSGDGQGVFIFASRDNCWFEGRYIGSS